MLGLKCYHFFKHVSLIFLSTWSNRKVVFGSFCDTLYGRKGATFFPYEPRNYLTSTMNQSIWKYCKCVLQVIYWNKSPWDALLWNWTMETIEQTFWCKQYGIHPKTFFKTWGELNMTVFHILPSTMRSSYEKTNDKNLSEPYECNFM